MEGKEAANFMAVHIPDTETPANYAARDASAKIILAWFVNRELVLRALLACRETVRKHSNLALQAIGLRRARAPLATCRLTSH